MFLTKSALNKARIKIPKGDVLLTVMCYPMGNYGYDRDNMSGRLKSAYDGIADAIGINDKYFRHIIDMAPADKLNPRVEVTLTW
jgi:crossover junction endodeoxyribonuclease RusA